MNSADFDFHAARRRWILGGLGVGLGVPQMVEWRLRPGAARGLLRAALLAGWLEARA